MTKTIDEIRAALDVLRQIAYPRRGTAEEENTLQQFANAIQSRWSLADLERLSGRDEEANPVRARLQKIALQTEVELPINQGFFLLCFPFLNVTGGRAEYVSNAQRRDVIAAMREFIERNPMSEAGHN